MAENGKDAKFALWGLSLMGWVCLLLCLGVVAWYYVGYQPLQGGTSSMLDWLLYRGWAVHLRNDYLSSLIILPIAVFMLWHGLRRKPALEVAPSLWGLLWLGGACFCCFAAVRTHQGRAAIMALPLILSGLVWCYWGGKAFWRSLFPLTYLWLMTPIPGMAQSTVWLQLLATKGAAWVAGAFGVETIVQGTNILSADGSWDAFEIAGGCSGLHSLISLMTISLAWAYLAYKLSMWKRVLLALSAFPLAVVGNALRVGSIFVVADYINPEVAGHTWHDWSALVIFFPASLMGLMLLHGLLSGEIPFLKRRKVVVIRQQNAQVQPELKIETQEKN